MNLKHALNLILDRNANVSGLADELLLHWQYDLYSRRPGPALVENGTLKPTDLDLACFMAALVDRKAVINLPKYESRRAKTTREGEHVVSSKNRHGKVVGLTANKEVFSFSVRVIDMNVMAQSPAGEDTVGAFRNFMLVDLDGTWHDGWECIEFMPSAKENAFLTENKLWTENVVYFKNFVHPNRWTSFYGQYYFVTKALIQRLEDENKHRRAEIKRLEEAGVRLPKDVEQKEWPKSERGESKAVLVKAFEAEVDAPWTGEFQKLEESSGALAEATAIVRKLQYTVLPALRFATRATELSFVKAGTSNRKTPAWIRGEWEPGYREAGKRIEWERLALDDGRALRFREYEKTERVAP